MIKCKYNVIHIRLQTNLTRKSLDVQIFMAEFTYACALVLLGVILYEQNVHSSGFSLGRRIFKITFLCIDCFSHSEGVYLLLINTLEILYIVAVMAHMIYHQIKIILGCLPYYGLNMYHLLIIYFNLTLNQIYSFCQVIH